MVTTLIYSIYFQISNIFKFILPQLIDNFTVTIRCIKNNYKRGFYYGKHFIKKTKEAFKENLS